MNDVLNYVTYNLRMYWEHYPRLELHYHFQIITSSKGYEYDCIITIIVVRIVKFIRLTKL